METIGDRIAMLRKGRGITQRQLAQKIDSHENTVSQWETGRCFPNAVMIIELSDLFGVTTDWILKGGNR